MSRVVVDSFDVAHRATHAYGATIQACDTHHVKGADDLPRAPQNSRRGRMGIQSIDRAVEALEALAVTGTASVGQVADRLGVHKSTASRILASLAAHGLVEQRDAGGAYSLGFGLVRLASAVTSRLDFSQIAQRLCDRVAEDLSLTANVAVLDDVHAVNVSQAVGTGLLAPRHYVGLRTPGHATSSGKLLLAHSESARRTIASRTLDAHTDRTITRSDALEAGARTGPHAGLGSVERGVGAAHHRRRRAPAPARWNGRSRAHRHRPHPQPPARGLRADGAADARAGHGLGPVVVRQDLGPAAPTRPAPRTLYAQLQLTTLLRRGLDDRSLPSTCRGPRD